MTAAIIPFGAPAPVDAEREAALGARRRSLEAKQQHIRRELQRLEEEEALAGGALLWDVIIGGPETTTEFVDRLTKAAMQRLADNFPDDALLSLDMAAHHVRLALKYVAERKEKVRRARTPRRRTAPGTDADD